MQRLWHGVYLNGRSAKRHPITIQLAREALHIRTSDDRSVTWPYNRIRQIQGSYEGEPVRLEYGAEPAQSIVVQDIGFLDALQEAAVTRIGHVHDPRRRTLRLRLTVVSALALVPVIAGLYLWGIPSVANILAPLMPLSWEERLGNSVFEHVAPADLRCNDARRSAKLERILGRLSAAVSDSPYHLQLTVVDRPVINAFALPGGRIVVLRGLLEAADTPEQLAGVLAHELQHVYKRHSVRAVMEQVSTGLLIAAVTGDITGTLASGIEGARVLGMLRYSRLHEEEADREGLRMLKAAEIDAAGMIAFYRMMEGKQSRRTNAPSYLSTHPDTGDRIANLVTLAGPSPLNPAALLSGEEWNDARSICQRRVASPAIGK